MLIALFILFLVGMDGQVAVLKADQALLLCLKAVAGCSSYQGRWMADSDVIAAIRHEYSFWDSDFAKVLTYTKLNKVVKKDPVLGLKMSGEDGSNDSGVFRRQYKPKELTYTSVDISNGGYKVENDTKKATREPCWYFFGTAKRIKEKNKTGKVWYAANGGLSSGDVVKNDRTRLKVSMDERIRIATALGVGLAAGTKQTADESEGNGNNSDDMDVDTDASMRTDALKENFRIAAAGIRSTVHCSSVHVQSSTSTFFRKFDRR